MIAGSSSGGCSPKLGEEDRAVGKREISGNRQNTGRQTGRNRAEDLDTGCCQVGPGTVMGIGTVVGRDVLKATLDSENTGEARAIIDPTTHAVG